MMASSRQRGSTRRGSPRRGAAARGSAPHRGAIAFIVILIVIGALALGISKLWQAAQSVTKSAGCEIGSYTLDLEQTQNASIMVSTVIKRNLPERAAVLSLAAALQESKLRNIAAGAGDRDSVGILQQRPSQGWGTAAQIADVHYATGKFLDALVKVTNWQSVDFASAIQEVQRSADGSAYAKHEPQAQVLSDAMFGRPPAGVSCSFPKPTAVTAATAISRQLMADLPVKAPEVSGVTLRVPGAAWTTVAWLVSHADTYGIDSVSYAGQQWTRSKGWKPSPAAELNAVSASVAIIAA